MFSAGSIFLLFSSSFFGFEVFASLLGEIFDAFTIAGIGSAFGIIFSAWIFFISSLFIPLSQAHGITHALILISTAAIIHFTRKTKKCKKFGASPIIFVFSVVVPFLFLSWFIETSLLYKDNQVRGACYGDLPFHLSLISSFSHGCNKERRSLFDILTPFFANQTLAYTFIPDYYSAVFISCFKDDFHTSLTLPSFIYAYSIFIILFNIVRIFTKDEKACLFAPWLFLFTGGLGFTEYNKYKHEYYIDFVNIWGNGRTEGWFQTVIHILLPQRCSLFSMPIAYSIILILMVVGKSSEINPAPFFGIGLLVAALPQVQLHSVVAVAQWGIIYVLRAFPYRSIKTHFKPFFVNYLILALTAIILGAPQVFPFLGRMASSQAGQSFVQFRPLWDETDHNFFTFWGYALGLFFVLSIFGRFIFFFTLDRDQGQFYDPSLGVFLIANFIWYQPWNLDNTKVFNAGWIPLAVALISHFFIKLWKKVKIVGPILTIGLFIFCTLSGFLANYLAATRPYMVWSQQEKPFMIAQWVVANTDPKSIWITDTYHASPVVSVAGRQTLVGYQGWISSHGLNDRERVAVIRGLQINPENTLLTDKYNVTYVFTRAATQKEFNFQPNENSKFWKKVFQTHTQVIYKRTNYTL